MSNLTEHDAYIAAKKELEPIRKKQENRVKKIITNVGTIVTITIIVLSMVLFAYNKGYCTIYSIPSTALSLDISRLIPVAVQLMGIIGFIFMYISSILTDHMINHPKFRITRAMICSTICSWLIFQNNLIYALSYWCLLIIIGVPVALEILIILMIKKTNKPITNQNIDEETFIYKKREFISSGIFPHYSIKMVASIIAIFICLSPLVGMFSATTKRDYQVFSQNDQYYAVVYDYSDTMIVQKATISDNTLEINTDKYYYCTKDDVEFLKVVFKNVDIRYHDNEQILQELQATSDQITSK